MVVLVTAEVSPQCAEFLKNKVERMALLFNGFSLYLILSIPFVFNFMISISANTFKIG